MRPRKTPRELHKRHAELLRSLRTGRIVTLVLLSNMAAFCLGYWILGGTELLSETREGESWLKPLHGEAFQVSNAVGWYSLLHGISVVLTVPSLALCLVMLAWEWAQLRLVRCRLQAL